MTLESQCSSRQTYSALSSIRAQRPCPSANKKNPKWQCRGPKWDIGGVFYVLVIIFSVHVIVVRGAECKGLVFGGWPSVSTHNPLGDYGRPVLPAIHQKRNRTVPVSDPFLTSIPRR